MKRTFLTIVVAAQLAAGVSFAETSNSTSGSTGATGSTGMSSKTYGSDWSPTLGPAMFIDDRTKVRSDSDIVAMWSGLSDADKTMIRRDCAAQKAQSSTTSGTAGATAGTTSGKTAAGAVGETTSTTGVTTDTSAGSNTTTQSGKSAANSTGTKSSTNFSTTGTTGAATTPSGATAGKDGAQADTVMQVSSMQMDQICAATKGL